MSTRPIIEQGDEALNKRCHPVTNFDERLWELLDDLQDTLAEAHGYGLAAPQVGILRRVCLVTASDGHVIELVNPEILETSGEQEGYEGCLSVPGLYGWVKRPDRAKVRAQDRNGKTFEVEDVGMTARCFCHEIEHLDGHLFTERVMGRLYTEEELDAIQAAAEEKEQKRRKRH